MFIQAADLSDFLLRGGSTQLVAGLSGNPSMLGLPLAGMPENTTVPCSAELQVSHGALLTSVCKANFQLRKFFKNSSHKHGANGYGCFRGHA